MEKAGDMDRLLFGTGLGVFDTASTGEANRGPLNQRCVVPPYSTLNTRDGFWQDRKRAWVAMGLKSEVGREGNLTYGLPDTLADGTTARMKGDGGTSVFDPVLCELAYLWWTAPGQKVLDPFAGGSVRGVVAAAMGRRYVGCELRGEQVAANREQALAIHQATPGLLKTRPLWVQGDSLQTVPQQAGDFDFVFSCPPYGNLEVYSDDPADISNRSHQDFLVAYRAIIAAACDRLQNDRFAAFVVSNYRPKENSGKMINFVGDTVAAFEDAGLSFYNDVVLINCVGTAALRANTNFVRGHRKVVKLHQNLLVFVKGSPARAAANLPHLTNEETGT